MELTRVNVKAETMQHNDVISDATAHAILSITTQRMHRRLCRLLQESYIIVPTLREAASLFGVSSLEMSFREVGDSSVCAPLNLTISFIIFVAFDEYGTIESESKRGAINSTAPTPTTPCCVDG